MLMGRLLWRCSISPPPLADQIASSHAAPSSKDIISNNNESKSPIPTRTENVPKQNGSATSQQFNEKNVAATTSSQEPLEQHMKMDVDEAGPAHAESFSISKDNKLSPKDSVMEDAAPANGENDATKPTDTEMNDTPVAAFQVADAPDSGDSVSQPGGNIFSIAEGVQSRPVEESKSEAQNTVAFSDNEPPKSPSKVSRAREDDGADEPAPKRMRTHSQEPAAIDTDSNLPTITAMSEVTGNVSVNEAVPKQEDWIEYADKEVDNGPLNQILTREAKKAVAGIKKTKMGEKLFSPVWVNWPEIKEGYQATIKNPMDFGQVEKKLKEGSYNTVQELKDDVNLIYANCFLYNGAVHHVTQQTHGYVKRVMDALKDASHERHRSHRKESKVTPAPPKRQPEPRAATQKPRRESIVAPVSPSASKIPGDSVFAPNPSGMPLIRRDPSNLEDKRPIVPPKNKDLEYANKSQKKKLTVEMRFYEELLTKLRRDENSQAFQVPVDPVALNIPTYFQIIKKPMDLATIGEKLESGQYKKGKDVESDISLMFKNCYKFNPVGNPVHEAGKLLEDRFKNLLVDKDDWMKKHAPPPIPPKTTRRPQESDSEESEVEEAESVEEPGDTKLSQHIIKQLEMRVREETERISRELAKQIPDDSVVNVCQIMLSAAQSALIAEKKKFAETAKKQPPTKSKLPKASKKAVNTPFKKKETATKKPSKKKAPAKTKRPDPTSFHRGVITDGILSLPEDDMNMCIEIIKRDTRSEVRKFLFAPTEISTLIAV